MKSKKTKSKKLPVVELSERMFAGRETSMVAMKDLVRTVVGINGDTWRAGDIAKCFSGLISRQDPFFYWNNEWKKLPEDWHDSMDHLGLDRLLNKAYVPARWAKQVLKLVKLDVTGVYAETPPRVEIAYGEDDDTTLKKFLRTHNLAADWNK